MERVAAAAAAAATSFDDPLTVKWLPRMAHEPFIEIRSLNLIEEVVAIIEVLSPTNKEPGPGRESNKEKQGAVWSSTVHLLEIDLLRTGQRSLPPDGEVLVPASPDFDYLISLHKAGQGSVADLWSVRLPHRLPRLRLPLADEETFVPLDLQTVVNRACSEGGIAKKLLRSYKLPPNPPLNANDAAWSDALLRECGLRP